MDIGEYEECLQYWRPVRKIMTVTSRALVRYPQRVPLPCKIKGCANKKRNGRCGLEECLLELDENEKLTGKCLSFKMSEKYRRID